MRSRGTASAANGKLIERNVFSEAFETNRANIAAEPLLYKRRQAIVEHPFGTIKRQWGFDHVLSKNGRKRASADVGLIFIAYNLRRTWNILKDNGLNAAFLADIRAARAFFNAFRASMGRLLNFIEISAVRLTFG